MRGLIDRALAWVSDHAWKGYGTAIDISSYNTSSNKYTVPSDGIVKLICNYRSTAYIAVKICNSDDSGEQTYQIGAAGSATEYLCIPVFKGQKVYRSANNGAGGNNFVNYFPYINYGGGYI